MYERKKLKGIYE